MSIADLFAPFVPPRDLWASQSKAIVLSSLERANRAATEAQRQQWRQLRDYLDSVHKVHMLAHAAVSHPETVHLWQAADGAAARAFRLVEMVAERLSVAFHRPPKLYFHVGNHERLTAEHPTYGRQVAQWEQDQEDCELDTTLSYIDASTNVLGQQAVSPAWVSDGTTGRMTWQVYDPQDTYVDPSLVAPQDISLARSVSLAIRDPNDIVGAAPRLWSTWTRTVTNGRARYEHWYHDDRGATPSMPLFGEPENGYGVIPVVMWRRDRPSQGRVYLPPDEVLLSAQVGVDVAITDLYYGLRYSAHPQWVLRGSAPAPGKVRLGPDAMAEVPEDSDLASITPSLNVDAVMRVIEWSLQMEAISRSLPADIFSPSPARNLAALQEMRLDLKTRRERALPHYLRALKRTWDVHRAVSNYWARRSPELGRVEYAPELQLGVELAPIPRTEDRWQAAQSNQVELTQGLTNPVDILAQRENLPEDAARQKVASNLQTTWAFGDRPPGAAPTPAKAPGDQPRPASVERG